jgi:LysM repeat protein
MKYMKTAIVVTAVHLAAIGGIAFFSSSRSVTAKEIEGDKKALENSYSYKYVGMDDIIPAKPQATPVPTPKQPSSGNDWPKAKVHVVSKGDTFYGLVKKYKLNPDKFKKVNNIKDPNKIVLGKKLVLP